MEIWKFILSPWNSFPVKFCRAFLSDTRQGEGRKGQRLGKGSLLLRLNGKCHTGQQRVCCKVQGKGEQRGGYNEQGGRGGEAQLGKWGRWEMLLWCYWADIVVSTYSDHAQAGKLREGFSKGELGRFEFSKIMILFNCLSCWKKIKASFIIVIVQIFKSYNFCLFLFI